MIPRKESSRHRFDQYRAARLSKAADKPAPDGSKPDLKKRSRGFLELLRRFWAFTATGVGGAAGGHRAAIYLALTTVTIVTVLGLIIPASSKAAIDYVLTDNPGPSGIPERIRDALRLPLDREALLWRLGLFIVAVALVSTVIGTLGRWQITRVTKRLQAHLRRLTFEHASRLPLHRIYHYKSGGMASLLREDAGLAGELLFTMLYNPWRAVVQLVGTLAVLAWVDWRLLAGGLMVIPAIWVTHRAWITRIRPLYRDAKMVRQGIDATTTEAFAGMRVVRGFGRERGESSRFTGSQHYMTRIEVLTWWWSRVLEVVWTVLIPVASAAVLIYGGTQVVRGNLTVGDLMMFSTYLLMLLGPLETLTSTAANIQSNLAALDRILDLFEEREEFDGKRGGKVVTRDTARGDVELRDVWFTYPRPPRRFDTSTNGKPLGGDRRGTQEPGPVIKGVSLRVAAGETLALVGPSGSGKTTLCNLVARFYDTSAGAITFDGTDLRDIDVQSYRSLLGIVEQDVFLFDGTVAQNIAYGRPDAPAADITAAARAANAHAFIEALDKGYATLIGERGVRLSGGQKQRIAIARALLADPLILILDEATSNLDTESERLIQESLAVLMQGRTCFVIAHRLSTIRHADRIVVLEAGAVVEQGTHEDLLAREGRYAELLRLQIGGEWQVRSGQ